MIGYRYSRKIKDVTIFSTKLIISEGYNNGKITISTGPILECAP